jgi:hypothetical protein
MASISASLKVWINTVPRFLPSSKGTASSSGGAFLPVTIQDIYYVMDGTFFNSISSILKAARPRFLYSACLKDFCNLQTSRFAIQRLLLFAICNLQFSILILQFLARYKNEPHRKAQKYLGLFYIVQNYNGTELQ